MKKGYTCRCGKFNAFDLYALAHTDVRLAHKCECGRKNELLGGRVRRFGTLPSEGKRCTHCGEHKPSTSRRINAYDQDVNNDTHYQNLCDDCDQTLRADI